MQHIKRPIKKMPPIEITTSWPFHWHASSLTLLINIHAAGESNWPLLSFFIVVLNRRYRYGRLCESNSLLPETAKVSNPPGGGGCWSADLTDTWVTLGRDSFKHDIVVAYWVVYYTSLLKLTCLAWEVRITSIRELDESVTLVGEADLVYCG